MILSEVSKILFKGSEATLFIAYATTDFSNGIQLPISIQFKVVASDWINFGLYGAGGDAGTKKLKKLKTFLKTCGYEFGAP